MGRDAGGPDGVSGGGEQGRQSQQVEGKGPERRVLSTEATPGADEGGAGVQGLSGWGTVIVRVWAHPA